MLHCLSSHALAHVYLMEPSLIEERLGVFLDQRTVEMRRARVSCSRPMSKRCVLYRVFCLYVRNY